VRAALRASRIFSLFWRKFCLRFALRMAVELLYPSLEAISLSDSGLFGLQMTAQNASELLPFGSLVELRSGSRTHTMRLATVFGPLRHFNLAHPKSLIL
jgi:hypothetical protein